MYSRCEVVRARTTLAAQSLYRCSICDLNYNTLASLRRHINTSHSCYTLTEVFVCDVCGEEATTVKGIKSHQKLTHGEVLPPPVLHGAFPCPHCELSFPSKLSCSQQQLLLIAWELFSMYSFPFNWFSIHACIIHHHLVVMPVFAIGHDCLC